MRTRFWLGVSLVAAIAAGSLAVAWVVHEREVDNFERNQRSEAIRAARQAEAVAALSVGQLESAAAFYQADEEISAHEFDAIADSLLRTGALAGTAFIQAVRSGSRERFERVTGAPIVERTALDLRPARPRPIYFPVAFGKADVDVAFTLPRGYDVGVDPIRRSYMLRARDSGRPTATRVLRLVAGGIGINVFRPVYRDGAPVATVAQRRRALIGFAAGSFHVPDVASAASAALADGVDSQLVEGERGVSGPILPREEAATAPVRIADRAWLLVVRDPDRPGIALPALIAILGMALAALLAALVLVWSRNERMQELKRQANHDSLTGLRNRRRFEEDLRVELARSRRDGRKGALLLLDIDNFKQLNDTLGHQAGDRAIADVAEVLRSRSRITDGVARLGGDEFAVVLPHCELDEAEDIADAIAREIQLREAPGADLASTTASIGLATFGPQTSDYDAVLSAADHALYEAKRAGRNTVRVATGAVPTRPTKAAEPRT